MEIQSIYASINDGFTPKKLLRWIRKIGHEPIKRAHISGNSIRYRIQEPIIGKKYITYVLPNKVHLVLMK